MNKNKNIITDLVTIKIELTQAGKTQEWSGEHVARGYALKLFKSAIAALESDVSHRIIEVTQMECNACGHVLEPDDNYCSNCGAWQEK